MGEERKKEEEKERLIPLTLMGVLVPRSAHARLCARPPIDMSEHYPGHVNGESPSNISPNQLEVISKVLDL
jgi:hypothetical protein